MPDPPPTTIVYALYGSAHSGTLTLWQQTWLQGKRFVFVPDAPAGPFARSYRPVHSGSGKMPKDGKSEPSSLFRFRTDANMVWAACTPMMALDPGQTIHKLGDLTLGSRIGTDEANVTYPTADWTLVVDSDSFVFEETLRERSAQGRDRSSHALVGASGLLRPRRVTPLLRAPCSPSAPPPTAGACAISTRASPP